MRHHRQENYACRKTSSGSAAMLKIVLLLLVLPVIGIVLIIGLISWFVLIAAVFSFIEHRRINKEARARPPRPSWTKPTIYEKDY